MTTVVTRRAVAPLLVVALGIPAAGTSIVFVPHDPIDVARESQDASQVQPREISHIADMWQALRRVGDRGGPALGRWVVTAAKSEGVTPGLQMKDSAGQLYFVKFDSPSSPERGSGAESSRRSCCTGAGYHVPDNYIAIIGREDLHIAPGATNGATRSGRRGWPASTHWLISSSTTTRS